MSRQEAALFAVALLAALAWLAAIWVEAMAPADWRQHCESYRERVEAHGGRLECR
jgi:hypothetical protein